jgi:hypothetical protein
MSSIHQRAKDVFLAALARPADEQGAFLAEACGDDVALRQEVESLLQFHEDEKEAEAGVQADRDALDDPFAPGDLFAGRYRMIARLGRGGMGDVWRAEDLVLHIDVALKMIAAAGPDGRNASQRSPPGAPDYRPGRVSRLRRRRGRRRHLLLDGTGTRRGPRVLLRRVGRLPAEKVADIARQLCSGLAAAHAQGCCIAISSPRTS